jgi:hypothetical protein
LKGFARFQRKEWISDAALRKTIGSVEAGLVDADLGAAWSSSAWRASAWERAAATGQ